MFFRKYNAQLGTKSIALKKLIFLPKGGGKGKDLIIAVIYTNTYRPGQILCPHLLLYNKITAKFSDLTRQSLYCISLF